MASLLPVDPRYLSPVIAMTKERHEDYIIIGGGVAGICAAIELCLQGIRPTVIEAGTYPSHKVCGEFLSPECLPWIYKQHIDPISISNVRFRIEGKSLDFTFPTPAGSLSHLTLDPLLVERATSLGAKFLIETKVEAFYPKRHQADKHLLRLSTGESVSASSLIVAAGRVGSLSSRPSHAELPYVGIKAHFDGIRLEDLKMFGFRGAYLGLSPVEEGKANLACLATTKRVKEAGSPELLMQKLIAEYPDLREAVSSGTKLFDRWMSAPIPPFGFKKTPDWHDTYFIGDAALTAPPACGKGLSLSIAGGMMAARYAANKDAAGFKKSFRKRFLPSVLGAKAVHYLLMHPGTAKIALWGCNRSPVFARRFFEAISV